MPNITGMLSTIGAGSAGLYLQGSKGAFANPSNSTSGQLQSIGGGTTMRNANFDASNSNSTYGSSDTVTPLSESCKYIIHY